MDGVIVVGVHRPSMVSPANVCSSKAVASFHPRPVATGGPGRQGSRSRSARALGPGRGVYCRGRGLPRRQRRVVCEQLRESVSLQ